MIQRRTRTCIILYPLVHLFPPLLILGMSGEAQLEALIEVIATSARQAIAEYKKRGNETLRSAQRLTTL